jgi:hypothetical protein
LYAGALVPDMVGYGTAKLLFLLGNVLFLGRLGIEEKLHGEKGSRKNIPERVVITIVLLGFFSMLSLIECGSLSNRESGKPATFRNIWSASLFWRRLRPVVTKTLEQPATPSVPAQNTNKPGGGPNTKIRPTSLPQRATLKTKKPEVTEDDMARYGAVPEGPPYTDQQTGKDVLEEQARLERMTQGAFRSFLVNTIRDLREFGAQWQFPANIPMDEPPILPDGEQDPQAMKDYNERLAKKLHNINEVWPANRYKAFIKQFPKFWILIEYLNGRFQDVKLPESCSQPSPGEKKMDDGVAFTCADYLQQIMDNKFARQ